MSTKTIRAKQGTSPKMKELPRHGLTLPLSYSPCPSLKLQLSLPFSSLSFLSGCLPDLPTPLWLPPFTSELATLLLPSFLSDCYDILLITHFLFSDILFLIFPSTLNALSNYLTSTYYLFHPLSNKKIRIH